MDILLIVALGALLIFFMFNSRKKRQQQQEKLSAGLAPGAKVMTTFGLFGTVIDVNPEENKVTIESGPGTVLTVHRQAIGNVENPVADQEPEVPDVAPASDIPADTEVPDDISSLSDSADADDAQAGAGEPADSEAESETEAAPAGSVGEDAPDAAEQEKKQQGESAEEDREDGASGGTRG